MKGNLMSKPVECVSASDPNMVLDGGTVYAYSNEPVYMIRRDDGSTFTWNESIVRPAPPEPTLEVPKRLIDKLEAAYDGGQVFSTSDVVREILASVREQS